MDGITPNSRTSCKKLVEQGVAPDLAEALATWQQEELTNWAASGQAKNDMEHRAVLEKLDETLDKLAEERTKTLVTRDDLEPIKADLATLRAEINNVENRMLKWQIGIGCSILSVLGGIMARGFGWLGF